MSNGTLLAATLALTTVALVVVGTVWPVHAAAVYAGREHFLRSSADPESVVRNLGDDIGMQAWARAYASLGNKAQFTQADFVSDLRGHAPSLITYAVPEKTEVLPLRVSGNDATMRLKIYWATVVGPLVSVQDIHVVNDGAHWLALWPYVKAIPVPPQVVAVNYLRWDVIYRGAEDDWGAQDVEAPHVRIIDMHPVQRADGVVILGELLNEDVVPAFVSVSATLLGKNNTLIATEGSFDKISHLLLPKQVTPFLIRFSGISMDDVASVRMTPSSTLISASADPVIEIADQHLTAQPGELLTGKLINQSGRVVNVAHVLATFYDKSGQLIWVSDEYLKEALSPGTPVPFEVVVPQDIAGEVSTQRAVVATFSTEGLQ
jgi:hypothetical protein